jgi:PAS domain S-box-containing protein
MLMDSPNSYLESREDFLRALDAAAASLHRSAHSEVLIYATFAERVIDLGLSGSLSLLDEAGAYLTARVVAYPALAPLENFTGLRVEGFTFALSDVAVYQEVIATGKTLLVEVAPVVEQIVKEQADSTARQAIKAAFCGPGIFAPLRIEGRIAGVLSLVGKLTESYIPDVLAFAHHVSIALENARLFESIQQTGVQYRRLFEAANDGFIIGDPATARILSVNRKMLEITGYTESELLGLPMSRLSPPEEAPKARAFFSRIKEQGEGVLEITIARPDGELRLVECTVTNFDANDQKLMYGLLRDITERKRAENELRKIKEFNEGIIQNVFEGVAVSNAAGHFTFVNPGMARLLGYRPEELLGTHFLETVPPDQHPVILAADERRQRGVADRYEIELLRRDGTRLPVLVSGTPRYEEGQFAGALVVFTNISERKQMEAALRRRAEELAALYAASLEISVAIDLPTLLETIVERAVQLLGASGGALYLCDPDRQVARCVVSFNTPSDYTGTALQYGQGASGLVAQTGKPLLIENYSQWPDRAEVYEGQPIEAVLAVPMLWHEQVIGVIAALGKAATQQFSHSDLDLLALFANQAAIAVENARLLAAERAAHQQAELLSDVSRAVSESLDLHEVLHLILEQLKRVLTFDTASVLIYGDKGQPDLIAGIGYQNEVATSRAACDLLRDSPILAQMQRDLQPTVLTDVRQHSGWIWVPGAEHVRSFIAVPISAYEQMIGAFMVDSIQVGAFTESDVRLVQSLATHAAVAIKNARLFEAERAQLLLAQTLQEVGALLTSQSELSAVLENILDLLRRVIDYDSASILLLDENDRLYLAAGRGLEDIETTRQAVHEMRDHILSQVIDRKFNVIPDTYADSRWIIVPSEAHIRSWVGVPLKVKGSLIGSLNIDSRTVNAYDASTGETVLAFANQAAAAIDSARLFSALEQRAAELLALRQATLSLTASLQPKEVLNSILESTLKFLPNAMNAHVFLYDTERGSLNFGAALWPDGRRGRPIAEPRPEGLTYTVARSGESLIVADMRIHPLYAAMQPRPGWDGAIVGLPLKIGQRVVGVMNVSYPTPHNFSEAELRVLNSFGDQAAIAIENARLYEQAATERRHLSLLYEVGRELAASLNPDEILNRAISLTCRALGGLFGEAFLFEPATNRLRLRALFGRRQGAEASKDKLLDLNLGKGLAGWVALNQQPVNLPDVTQDSRWLHIPGVDEDVRSAILAPITADEQLLGVLSVLHHKPAVFTTAHLNLLQAICQQVRLALNNAERYQQVQNLVDMLASEKQRLKSLVESLPVGVVLLDDSYRLLATNPLGREILSRFGPSQEGEMITNLGPYPLVEIIERHSTLLPFEIVIDDPSRITLEALGRPIGGETRQWLITIQDVTRERENRMRSQMQERLATVGQLAAGIAHDFNNIMAAILVYTDLMMADTNLLAASRDRLLVIQQQVKRAAALIRQILDFSRRSVMDQAPLDLLPFMKELEKLLGRVLPETIHVELAYQSDEYMVRADPTHLQQVFMNLALNSRDAMPNGGRLHFGLQRILCQANTPLPFPDLPAGNWVCISIADTGQGIATEILPHIFEPFFTTKPVGQGTGLGLSQVYGIITQHNGYIDVSSQLGGGACFSIYLPALSQAQESHTSQEASVKLDGGGKIVLIVEDDVATREALKELLRTYNFQAFTAANGREALNALQQVGDSVVLLVTDVVMPEMGGVTLYQVVQERWPHIKVLFITGHPLDADNQALLEKDNIHWLQKPFAAKEFSAAIRLLLQSG